MGKTLGESELIKRPHKKTAYTKQQLEEFKKCADPITGPFYFMSNYFWTQHTTKGKVLYHPYTYQLRLIDAYHNNKRVVAMMPRQCGKCLTESINITIRNKKGEVYNIPIGIFYEYESAKRNGTQLPDISQYRQTRSSSVSENV